MIRRLTSRFGRLLALAGGLFLTAGVLSVGPARADDANDWLQKTFAKAVEPGPKRAKPSRLGGPITERPSRSESKGLGPSLSGGGKVNWVASSSCLNSSIRGIVNTIAATFGSVTVNSTCRSQAHNRRVGGASKSYHLTGDAVDFRVNGNWGGALAKLRGHWGGFTHYGGGLFHIDSGPRRTW